MCSHVFTGVKMFSDTVQLLACCANSYLSLAITIYPWNSAIHIDHIEGPAAPGSVVFLYSEAHDWLSDCTPMIRIKQTISVDGVAAWELSSNHT